MSGEKGNVFKGLLVALCVVMVVAVKIKGVEPIQPLIIILFILVGFACWFTMGKDHPHA